MSSYALPVAVVAGTGGLCLVLNPWLGPNLPFLLFLPGILAVGWYWGLGPGLLSLALSTAAALTYALNTGTPLGEVWLSGLLFVATGAGITWLNHRVRSSLEVSTTRSDRLEAVFNTSVDGIIVISARGTIEEFNRGAERLFGYPASEVTGRNVSVLMPSPDHEQHDRYLAGYLAGGEGTVIGKGRRVNGRRRDGTTFPLHLSVGEMKVDGERKFTGVLHDLSARARLEDELRASEARWRAVIESAIDGIIVIDGRGHIEAFNPAAERLFGFTQNEVVGQNVSMLMPRPYREEHDTYLARFLTTGNAKIIGMGREVTGKRKDGTTFPLHLSVGEATLDGQRRFTGIVHDLTERVRIETALREQATLAKLGEMAAVVAHEVKNPLAGIKAAVQLIGYSLPADHPDAGLIGDIVERIDTLDGLTKDLLLFARPPTMKKTPTDVRDLVETTASLLKQDPAFERLQIEVQGPSTSLAADGQMLKIVLQNLLINGAQAMAGDGLIYVRIHQDHDLCHISVADSGPGIPKDVRAKIFDPFFTTKARGSGLGLPTAKRFIDAHGGTIDVLCPPTGGTTIDIQLPVR